MLRLNSANPDDLARVHPWLDGELRRLPKALHHGMRVALEEVVLNIARHGYAGGAGGEIVIASRVSPDAAELVVEDDGVAFDPSIPPARAAQTADFEPGGLGLTLLHHYCTDIAWQRIGERNRLTLRFALPAG